jgi:tetratricopeptide (TPR) repeat protein
MGHYLLLTGYEGDTLTFHDSYKGPNKKENAAAFDELWKVFNRTAILVWPPEQEALVQSILGSLADPTTMYQQAVATAHAEVNRNPQDKFAWFNLGSSLIALGDTENAVQAFDIARSLQLPWRMLWYQFGPFEAYYNAGNYQEVINLTTTTLSAADNLEESYFWRGRAHAALGQIDAARSDLQRAVRLNPNFAPAQEALAALP